MDESFQQTNTPDQNNILLKWMMYTKYDSVHDLLTILSIVYMIDSVYTFLSIYTLNTVYDLPTLLSRLQFRVWSTYDSIYSLLDWFRLYFGHCLWSTYDSVYSLLDSFHTLNTVYDLLLLMIPSSLWHGTTLNQLDYRRCSMYRWNQVDYRKKCK